MAKATSRACKCGARIPPGEQCPRCTQERQQRVDEYRGSSNDRGYTSAWRRARFVFLSENPICADPFKVHGDRIAPASVVDHIKPHRGDWQLFWSIENWQSLCSRCHARKSAAEDGGFGNVSRVNAMG